jgi:hypothetical protein
VLPRNSSNNEAFAANDMVINNSFEDKRHCATSIARHGCQHDKHYRPGEKPALFNIQY